LVNRRVWGTYSIDTGPLLEEHSNSSNDNTLKHSLGLEQRTHSDELKFKDVSSSLFLQMRETLCQTPLLEKRLGLDFEEF